MPEENVVMYESPEAASIKTVTGGVSADGRFFGQDENLARFCGATHRRCENSLDHPIYKVRSYCAQCHEESRQAKFAAMPVKEWSGEPLVIFDGDQYFFDSDSLRDFIIDSEIELADLQLCIYDAKYAQRDRPQRHVLR
ncbi:MAG: hypothetical protein ACOH2O_11385 [Pseudomonas sp.]